MEEAREGKGKRYDTVEDIFADEDFGDQGGNSANSWNSD
jgi:hypothetical protein